MDLTLLTDWLLSVPQSDGSSSIAFECGAPGSITESSSRSISHEERHQLPERHRDAAVLMMVFKAGVLASFSMDYGMLRPLVRRLACANRWWKICAVQFHAHMFANYYVCSSDSVALPPVSSRQYRQEVIHLQIGGCGNQLGTRFWEYVCAEHGFDDTGASTGMSDLPLDCINTYFNATSDGRFRPRAILVDLEPSCIDAVLASNAGKLFSFDNVICGKTGSAHKWSVGHYTKGAESSGVILDAIRREAEHCDSLQGFQLVHSLGGGTGAGLGSLIMLNLRDEYPDLINFSCSVLSSPKVTSTILEPYNTMLSIHQFIENMDACILVDNDALYNIHVREWGSPSSPSDLNGIATRALTNLTSGFRLPDRMNHTSLRKLLVQMVPFPRAHFLTCASVPLMWPAQKRIFSKWSSVDMVQQAFSERSFLCSCDPRCGRYLSCNLTLRGDFLLTEVAQSIIDQRREPDLFVDFIADNVKINACDIPKDGRHLRRECALLANTTSVEKVLSRVKDEFSAMWRVKAFVHSSTFEGMDEMEFQESHDNVCDLISEYKRLQESCNDSDSSDVSD